MPRRLTVAGDLFHGRVPDGAVYIGRAAPGLRRSQWHNPFVVGRPAPPPWFGGVKVADRGHAVDLYAEYIDLCPVLRFAVESTLAGRDLACWCKPGVRCHGDVLLAVANPEENP